MSRPGCVLLDTSVIIDLADVELGVHQSAEPAVSAVSVAELAFGYGTMAAVIRRAGRNPRPRRMDLQIAATAAAQAIPLITRDVAGFAGLERLLDVVVV